MEILVQSSTIIPQANRESAPPLEMPLTIFSRYAPDHHFPIIFGFTPSTPPNSVIVESLIKTLLYFPTFTGTLGHCRNEPGRPCVLVGGSGGGALLVEATVASKLADHLPLEPGPYLLSLHPPFEGTVPDEKRPQLLQVQLNRFACGGIIIGVTIHHHVADGRSMGIFINTFGQTVRGAPIEPIPSSETSWIKPRCPPRIEFEHWGTEFLSKSDRIGKKGYLQSISTDPEKNSNLMLHYSQEYITNRLKAKGSNKYSTFKLLLGHLWRKITIARGLDDKETTTIRVAVNGSSRLKMAGPAGFVGNLVLDAYPSANVKVLIEGGVEVAARIVHEAVAKINGQYFQSFIDFGEINKGQEMISSCDVATSILEADSLLGFPYPELDLGGTGALCAFTTTWIPQDGLLVFLPSQRGARGVDVQVCLKKEHARILKQISHYLE